MKDSATIFSVNPIDLLLSNGQFGHQSVAGAGNVFYGSTKIGNRTLLRDLGNDNFQPFVITGEEIAADLCGRYDMDGLFMTEDGSDPSPKKLKEEQAKFRAACVTNCRHADAIWDRSHNRELIDERARRSARYLNLQPAWADAVAEESKECPFCAEKIKARALFCKECKKELPVDAPVTVKK